ncbi:hypothetical protein GGI43DRAFT_394078 [Trichoderma evansii]
MSRLDGVDALRGVGLGEIISILLFKRTVEGLVEERVHFIHLELGLEVGEVVMGETVRAATGVGEAEVLINDFLTHTSPVAFAIAVFLHLLGISVDIAALGKEARQLFCRRDAAISETLVVTFAILVRASHFDGWMVGGDKTKARRRRGKTEAVAGGGFWR